MSVGNGISYEILRLQGLNFAQRNALESIYKGCLKMEWIQVLTIILSIAALIFYLHKDFKENIDREVRKIDDFIKQQSVRTDKLYEMFIDLVKHKK